MYELKVKSTDIVLVTYHREHMLRKTLRAIKERTRFPHRIILIDNGSDFTDEDKKLIDECCALYIKSPEGSTGFGPAENLGLKYVETEYFVITCNDILPPDLQPCWLERLSVLIETHPQFGGINCRAQYMPRCSYNDQIQQVYEQRVMLQGYLRIQRTEEMRKIGGIPFQPKGNHMYESIGFVYGVKHFLKKRCGSAAHVHCDHFGWEEENKGYPKGFDNYEYKVHITKEMPKLDPMTCSPLDHECPHWPYNDPDFVPLIPSEEECVIDLIPEEEQPRRKSELPKEVKEEVKIELPKVESVVVEQKMELKEEVMVSDQINEIREKRKERWLKRRQQNG